MIGVYKKNMRHNILFVNACKKVDQ